MAPMARHHRPRVRHLLLLPVRPHAACRGECQPHTDAHDGAHAHGQRGRDGARVGSGLGLGLGPGPCGQDGERARVVMPTLPAQHPTRPSRPPTSRRGCARSTRPVLGRVRVHAACVATAGSAAAPHIALMTAPPPCFLRRGQSCSASSSSTGCTPR
eukprot:scaffold13069_cov50-Phaeocystis_antarctica.AAC.3